MSIPSRPKSVPYLTLFTPLYFLLFSFILTPTAVAIPAPANGDPCGPATQDNPNYPNTCNAIPALAPAPAPYSINCTADIDIARFPALVIPWANCSASLQSACTRIEDFRTLPGRWIQTELAKGCSLKFFLPPFQGSTPKPTAQRCMEIFTALSDSCATAVPPSNIGSINLRTIPGYDPSYYIGDNVGKGSPSRNVTFEGNAVNVGYPSYLITGAINPNY